MVSVTPLDSLRMRVYLASRGLWLTLDAGRFETVELNARTGAVRVGLASATPETPQARLRIEQPAKVAGIGNYQPSQSLKQGSTWVELSSGK